MNLLENMEQGSFTRDFEGKMQKEVLETDASLLRDPLGNLGSPLTGNFKRKLEGSGKGASFFAGALLGGSFQGIWKDMGRRAQGTDMSIHRKL
jgi:hypothetical protein